MADTKVNVGIKTTGTKQSVGNIRKVAKSIDEVNSSSNTFTKVQTRQAQSSASSARAFSAQANGLGGLVAAYAGAAATAYALQAAFDALSRSARFEQTINGLNALAATAGETGSSVIANIREISKNQLTMAESASQASLTLSAGFDSTQITGLTEVALKASRALGRDLTDAMTRVVRGSAKMETELLDELGIYTKIGPATSAYAAAIGKAVNDLTEYERRQAFVNAVIEEGNRKFSVINTTIPTAAEKLSAFGTKLLDIGTQLGSILAHVFAPLADFLTNNLSGSIVAVGVAFSLISGKAIQELAKGLDIFSNKVEKVSNNVENFIVSFSKSAKTNAKEAQIAFASLGTKSTGGTKGIYKDMKEDFDAYKLAAKEGTLSSTQAAKAVKLLDQRMINLNSTRKDEIARVAAARDKKKQLEQAIKSSSNATKEERLEVAKLKQDLLKTNKQVEMYRKRILSTREALIATEAAQKKFNASISGPIAFMSRFAGGVVKSTGAAITSFGHMASKAVSIGSSIALWGSLLVGAGSAVAGLLGKQEEYNAILGEGYKLVQGFLQSLTSKKTTTALLGISSKELMSLEKADSYLKDIEEFTSKKRVFGIEIELTKTKEDLVREVSDAVDTAINGKQWSDSLVSAEAGIGAGIGAAVGTGLGAGIGTFIGGPLGAIVGAKLGFWAGTVIGVGIGASIDKYEALDTLGEKAASKLKAAYGQGLFDGEQGAILARALAVIEKQAGASKNLSVQARKYYETQQKIVIAMKGQLYNLAQLQNLASELGTTVGELTSRYTASVSAFNNTILTPKIDMPGNLGITISLINEQEFLESVDSVISSLRDRVQPSSNIFSKSWDSIKSSVTGDPSATQVFNDLQLLPAYKKRLAELKEGTGIVLPGTDTKALIEDYENRIKRIKDAANKIELPLTNVDVSNINNFEEALRTGLETAQTASKSFLQLQDSTNKITLSADLGTLTLEQLSQAEGIQTKLLDDAKRNTKTAATQAAEAERYLASLKAISGIPPDIINSQEQLVNKLQESVRANQSNLANVENTLVAYQNSIEPIEKQLHLHQQIDDILGSYTKQNNNLIGIVSEEGKIITDSNDVLVEKLKYATNIVTAYQDAYNTQQNQIKAAKDMINSDGITAKQAQLIASAKVEQKELALENIGLTIEQKDKALSIVKTTAKQALQADAVTKSLEAQKNITIELAKAAAAQLDKLSKQLDTLDEKLAESKIKLEQDTITRDIQFKIDSTNAAFELEKAMSNFKIEKLQLEIELIQAKVDNKKLSPTLGAIQENEKYKQILDERRKLITLEYEQAAARIVEEIKLIETKRTADIAAVDLEAKNQKDAIDAELGLITGWLAARSEYLSKTQEVTNRQAVVLVEAGNAMGNAIYNGIHAGAIELAAANKVDNLPTVGFTKTSSDIVSAVETDLSTSILTTMAKAAITKSEIDANAKAQKEAIRNTATQAIQSKADEFVAAKQNHDNQMVLAGIRDDIETENAEKRIKDAKEAGGKLSELQKKLKELFDSFKGTIENTLMSLNDLLFYGEGNFGDIIGNMFKKMQQDFFRITIADPLSEKLTTSLFGAFGVTMKKGADNADLIPIAGKNALLVSLIGGPSGFFGDLGAQNDEAAKGATSLFGQGGMLSNMFTRLFGENGFLSNLFSGLFGKNGVFASIMQGIGGLFGGGSSSIGTSIIGSVASGLFSMASGGSVRQYAAGGGVQHLAAGGASLRDRVPSLLEPGEFVIRKPAARSIGMPALQSMNATGNAVGSGNVQVIVNNQGSPKDATIGKPKFDGEKYIIDVITRDLSNNGPIRRSMRGDK